ncbi:MAG: hypothetical protein ACMXYK_03570 [Candidatus Woesearchaeota archaeon]
MNKEIEYGITGHLNNGLIEGYGKAIIVPGTGESEMTVRFNELPQGWDPRTIGLICCGRVIGYNSFEKDGAKNLENLSKGQITMGKHLPNVARTGFIYDEQNKLLTNVRAIADFDISRKSTHDISNISEGTSEIFPGINGIAEVKTPFYGSMVQVGPKVVAINTAYDIILEDGTLAHGTTFYPNFLPLQEETLDSPQLFTMTDLETSLKNNTLHIYTRSEVSPLVKSVNKEPAPKLQYQEK